MAEFNDEFDGMRVTETNQTDNGWTFMVELGEGEGLIEFWIDVDRDYWTRLTNRRVEPAELVAVTFKFLLAKGSKELLLKKFNLADVPGRYPDYETEMRRAL